MGAASTAATSTYEISHHCYSSKSISNSNSNSLVVLVVAGWFAIAHIILMAVFAGAVLLAEGIFMIVLATTPNAVSASHQSIIWQVLGFQWKSPTATQIVQMTVPDGSVLVACGCLLALQIFFDVNGELRESGNEIDPGTATLRETPPSTRLTHSWSPELLAEDDHDAVAGDGAATSPLPTKLAPEPEDEMHEPTIEEQLEAQWIEHGRGADSFFSPVLCYLGVALCALCGIVYASAITYPYLFLACSFLIYLAAGARVQHMLLMYVIAMQQSRVIHTTDMQIQWNGIQSLSAGPWMIMYSGLNLLFMFFIQFDFVHPSSIPTWVSGNMHYYGIWIEMPLSEVQYMWPFVVAFFANIGLFLVVRTRIHCSVK